MKPSPKKSLLFLTALSVLAPLAFSFPVDAASFANPLGNVTFRGIIINVIQFLLGLAALLSLLAIVVGGIRLTFGGFDNESEAARAKKIIFWAVAGLVVVILASFIVGLVATEFLGLNLNQN